MTPLERQPGVMSVHVTPLGHRYPVAECASCGRLKPIRRRGLCRGCENRHERDETITEYGQSKADRIAEYKRLRLSLRLPAAAARTGVSTRTAQRYEAVLREAAARSPCSLQAFLLA